MNNLKVETSNWVQDKELLAELRRVVFIEEQHVPQALEVDGLDPQCKHAKATVNGLTVGTGRLLPDGHIGRMCVHKDYRQYGIGTLLLNNLIEQALAAEYPEIVLNAQCDAIPFYEKNGFSIDSEEFMDAGIPHKRMIYKINL